jgi:hypothetical protein
MALMRAVPRGAKLQAAPAIRLCIDTMTAGPVGRQRQYACRYRGDSLPLTMVAIGGHWPQSGNMREQTCQ